MKSTQGARMPENQWNPGQCALPSPKSRLICRFSEIVQRTSTCSRKHYFSTALALSDLVSFFCMLVPVFTVFSFLSLLLRVWSYPWLKFFMKLNSIDIWRTSLLVLWLAFTHVGGKPSPPCRNGAPSTLSASLWSGLRYLINLIEERPFLSFLKNAIWVFFLGVNVFPSKCCSYIAFHFSRILCISKFFILPFFWSSFSPRGASVSTPLLATASVVFDFFWLMVVL